MTDRELLQQALDMLDDINQCSLPPTGIPLPAEIDHVMEALRARLAQPENKFNPDWDAMAVMVEEQQRMAKRVEELKAQLAQPEPEPFEYWNAVEGWVKIDEVRQHFDTAGCGTIYKTGGEGRVPLYTTPQREWVGLTDEVYEAMAEQYVTNCYFDTLKYAKAIEAKLRDKNS
jgi:hypothetical protein